METTEQFKKILAECSEVFYKKTQDYGTSWRILRLPSITDQIFIKANRIRSIQEKGKQKVAEDIRNELIGIINYCVIAIMQKDYAKPNDPMNVPKEHIFVTYNEIVNECIDLMQKKNHDYGESWRQMRVSSITDIILMKLLRVKQIEDNEGMTLVSEGVTANYQDILNYAVFCLILSY